MQIPQFEQDIKKLARKLHLNRQRKHWNSYFQTQPNLFKLQTILIMGALDDIHHIQKSYCLLSQILEELAKEFHHRLKIERN